MLASVAEGREAREEDHLWKRRAALRQEREMRTRKRARVRGGRLRRIGMSIVLKLDERGRVRLVVIVK